jgi:hypothetical protein
VFDTRYTSAANLIRMKLLCSKWKRWQAGTQWIMWINDSPAFYQCQIVKTENQGCTFSKIKINMPTDTACYSEANYKKTGTWGVSDKRDDGKTQKWQQTWLSSNFRNWPKYKSITEIVINDHQQNV